MARVGAVSVPVEIETVTEEQRRRMNEPPEPITTTMIVTTLDADDIAITGVGGYLVTEDKDLIVAGPPEHIESPDPAQVVAAQWRERQGTTLAYFLAGTWIRWRTQQE